jgi:hypothetical protein
MTVEEEPVQQIIDRTDKVLAALRQEKTCATCKHPTYASAGSEDEEGNFTKWVCINQHCPTYLEER